MSNSEWTTIESDPGVFTELFEAIGVKGVEMAELYDTTDTTQLEALEPVYGLVFLFKWRDQSDPRSVLAEIPADLFFANQVITNACATQAILAILMNAEGVDIGPELSTLKEFTRDFDPKLKGLTIGNSEVIRTAHNSFGRPDPYISEDKRPATKDDDVYHFVSLIPFKGVVYELDGLKAGPVPVGTYTEKSQWFKVALDSVNEKLSRHRDSHEFNLMAVTRKRHEVLSEQLAVAISMGNEMLAGSLQGRIEDEEEKHKKWKEENVRRKHNYVPFIMGLLKALAEKNALMPLLAESRAKHAARNQGNK